MFIVTSQILVLGHEMPHTHVYSSYIHDGEYCVCVGKHKFRKAAFVLFAPHEKALNREKPFSG